MPADLNPVSVKLSNATSVAIAAALSWRYSAAPRVLESSTLVFKSSGMGRLLLSTPVVCSGAAACAHAKDKMQRAPRSFRIAAHIAKARKRCLASPLHPRRASGVTSMKFPLADLADLADLAAAAAAVVLAGPAVALAGPVV